MGARVAPVHESTAFTETPVSSMISTLLTVRDFVGLKLVTLQSKSSPRNASTVGVTNVSANAGVLNARTRIPRPAIRAIAFIITNCFMNGLPSRFQTFGHLFDIPNRYMEFLHGCSPFARHEHGRVPLSSRVSPCAGMSSLEVVADADARPSGRRRRRRLRDACSLEQYVDSGQLGGERWAHCVLQCVDVGAERCGCDVVERFVGEGETYPVEGRLRQAVFLGGVADAGSGQLFPGREEGLE